MSLTAVTLFQKSSLTTIEYFMHSVPGGVKKHFPLTIIPPEGDLQVIHIYLSRNTFLRIDGVICDLELSRKAGRRSENIIQSD